MKLPRPISRRPFVFAALLAAGGFVAVSIFFAWQFTSPARRPLGAPPERFLSEYEKVRFTATDGVTLAGWFAPCAGAKQAVVLLHGYGSTRTQMLARAKFLHDHGYAALLYDARGQGESDGKLVSFGWYETRDLLGALDWLRGRGFHEFGCIGASQGGATIALAAAELREVRWVVLESVYPSLRNAVDRRFRHFLKLPGWLAGSLMIPIAAHRIGVDVDVICPCHSVEKLQCPLLVMAGSRDEHTRPEDAREIFDHATGARDFWLVPGAAHVDLYGFAKESYEQRLMGFLASVR